MAYVPPQYPTPNIPQTPAPSTNTPFSSQYLNQGASYLNQGAGAALPSLQSLDTASARIRSRMEGMRQAGEQSLRDQYGANVNSGDFRSRLAQNNQQAYNATAQGLGDLEQQYAKDRLQGAQTLGSIGNYFGNLGREDITGQTSGANATNDAAKTGIYGTQVMGTLGNETNQTNAQIDYNHGQSLLDFLRTFAPGGGDTYDTSGDDQASNFNNYMTGLLGSIFGNFGVGQLPAFRASRPSGTTTPGPQPNTPPIVAPPNYFFPGNFTGGKAIIPPS